MKNTTNTLLKLACCALAIGFASVASSSYAGPGPQQLHRITTEAQVSALKRGSEVVMTCAKCKTVQIAQVDKKGGALGWFQPKTKHLCPGCGGKMETLIVAGGKATASHFVHTCSQCGSASAFCCGMTGGKM